MNVAGVHLTWQLAAAGAAAAQWILVALVSVVAPVRMRKILAISTFAFAGAWLYAFNVSSITGTKSDAAQAAMVQGQHHNGSCASIRNGMSTYEVRMKLGSPDETRSDDIIRGPGSTTLIYRDIRCAVHLFDDKVDLVD